MKSSLIYYLVVSPPVAVQGFGLGKTFSGRQDNKIRLKPVVLVLPSCSPCCSPACGDNILHAEKENTVHDSNKREFLKRFIPSSSIMLGLTAMTSFPQENQAACLAGDTSVDCIGFYKVPIDEAIRSMVGTPEQLAKYAPDLRWVPPIEYPKNYKLAKDEILDLKTNVQGLTPLISKGDLTAAGVEILRIVPRITVAGQVMIRSLNNTNEFSMKAFRIEVAHSELLACLGSVDVLIGQSFAGQLGSITAAQIQILEELRNANEQYDELVKALPEGYSG
jgi:hypothetical protein